ILSWLRRRAGLPHLKPTPRVKKAFLGSGIGLTALTLAMAKAVPALDENGNFHGCKIPLYPFCKICPSQQVCPVAVGGPNNYPGLPTWEWGFGFFITACVLLLSVFIFCFLTSRRLWCRLCPMGIFPGLFSRGGMFTLRKDNLKCNQCGACTEVCPVDIDRVRAATEDSDVTGADCLLCLKCLEKCPRDKCLSLEHADFTVTESRFRAKHEPASLRKTHD
ncbi:MAG: 4Fe-4S dicluster domain-containing protein, partial [Planctomycetes bacterium]|nr:4Fe-4S dicluster domain-containing protein [Planctomycetota bacterium]